MSRWHTLDLTRPLADLREHAGLSQGDAAPLLGHQNTVGGRASVSKAERRGAAVLLSTLLRAIDAFGYVLEIRVRKKDRTPP